MSPPQEPHPTALSPSGLDRLSYPTTKLVPTPLCSGDMSANHTDASSEQSADETNLVVGGPRSDDEQPVVVKFEEVSAAAFKIRGGVERTPCNVSFDNGFLYRSSLDV